MSRVPPALRSAARRYAAVGPAAAWNARGKLGMDPVYAALLDEGLGTARSVVDLGCGRGLALAAALAARPAGLPRAALVGIERDPGAVRIARGALGDAAEILERDLADADVPPAEVVLLLDVLHYLDEGVQDALLARVATALRGGGRLFVREADAGAGWRFAAVRASERVMALSRGEGFRPFRYRSGEEWRQALARVGLPALLLPMGAGTPFANVLLVARASA